MAKNQGPMGQKDADPMMILAIGVLAFIVVAVLWMRFHTQVATFYSWVRIAEFGVFWGIGELTSYLSTPFHDWAVFFLKSDKSLIEWRHMTASSVLVNMCLLVMGLVPFAYRMAKRSMKNNPYNHLNYGKLKDYTLHTFTDTMSAVYPHLKLFRKLDLTHRPINSGKYAMADTAKQFAIKHDLLDIVVKGREFTVNRERAAAIFRGQLGRPWRGFENLTPSEFAVIAALLPRIAATDVAMPDQEYNAAMKTTVDLIKGYWASAAESYNKETDSLTVDVSKAVGVVKKYLNHPNVRKICESHAYVSTVIYRLMHECRVLGVLQPAEFRWLRVTDRRLWLVVDNVGRIVSTTEISGVYAHFTHELHQKRAIERPAVDNAVLALIEAVDAFAFSESEVEEIKLKAEQAEKSKAGIDVGALQKERPPLFLSVVDVDGRVIEASVVGEDGKAVFSGRCKLETLLTAGDQARLGLSEEAVKKLRNEPVTAEALKKRLLDICNKHQVCVFGGGSVVLVPGLDRSADDIIDLRQQLQVIGKADGESLEQALQALGLTVDVSEAATWSLAECLRARAVWVALEKMRLMAERADEKAAQKK